MWIIGLASLIFGIGGAIARREQAKRQNDREEDLTNQEIARLQEWYNDQQSIYNTNVRHAEEGAALATEHVTEAGTAKMADQRQDRDLTVDNTQERTRMAAEDVLGAAVQAAGQTGQATAAAGFSGLANEGTVSKGLAQTEDFGQWSIDQANAKLDLQRDLGFQEAYGFERGAIRTGEEMNRQLESIDQQLTHNLESQNQQFDLLTDRYQFDRAALDQQLDWLKEDETAINVNMGFDVLGAGIEFMKFGYEYLGFGGK